MSPIPLGILASSGGAAGPAFELISTQVLSGTATSITFSSLPNSFRHLQIRSVARTDFSNTFGYLQDIRLTMNSDTGTNYISHRLSSYGSTPTSQTDGLTNQIRLGEAVAAGDTPANIFSPSILEILDYTSTTKNKTTRAMTGTHNPNESAVLLQSGVWFSTSVVSSITLTSAFGNFVAGSRFSIYGTRG